MSNGKKTEQWMKENDDGSVTVTLSRPLEVNGAKLATLTMREPLVRDHVAARKSKGDAEDQEISLFANLCEVAQDDIQGLRAKDYARLQAVYLGFLD